MRRRLARTAAVLGVTGAAMLASAGSAGATFHDIQIRSIFRGPVDGTGFVELQMFSDGQNFVGGHTLRLYSPNGTTNTPFTIPINVANGGSQRMILIRDAATLQPADFTFAGFGATLQGLAGGGALCWDTVDCVSWGTFSGPGLLPSLTGTPINGGLSTNQVHVRDITRGCTTALDIGDDTNNSATDFGFAVGYQTRTNASTPTEVICPPPATTQTPKKKKRKCKKKKKKRAAAAAAKKRCKKKKKR